MMEYSYIAIRVIRYGSYYISHISPINNSSLGHSPNSNFPIYGSTDEVILISRIELNACHWSKPKRKNMFNIQKGKGFNIRLTRSITWYEIYKVGIYHSPCVGKHEDIHRNPIAKDGQFYPLMRKEDTATNSQPSLPTKIPKVDKFSNRRIDKCSKQ